MMELNPDVTRNLKRSGAATFANLNGSARRPREEARRRPRVFKQGANPHLRYIMQEAAAARATSEGRHRPARRCRNAIWFTTILSKKFVSGATVSTRDAAGSTSSARSNSE